MAGEFMVTPAPGFKRIHRAGCRYGKVPYNWADQFNGDEHELLVELMWTGAVMWHMGCRRCCPELDDGMRAAQESIAASGVYP